MLSVSDRLEFVPPAPPGLLRATALAILVHAFLLAALTWGVQWRRMATNVNIEAELWSALPQPAAPAPPIASASPEPQTSTRPNLPESTAPVDIAVEQAKQRQQQQAQRALEQQRLKREQQLIEKKRLLDKQEKDRKLVEDKKKLEQEKRRREALQAQQEAKRMEEERNKNLQRITGLAGSSGNANHSASATRALGPSPGYGGRISARIKPNIVFTDNINGNPVAEVDVRLAPNGSILSRQLTKSSGVKSWDDAVLKAIDKTEKLPPDTDGSVPSSLTIGFRPKD